MEAIYGYPDRGALTRPLLPGAVCMRTAISLVRAF